jgi:chorismate synthase
MRVAAGAIARKIIPEINIQAALVQVGKDKIDPDNWDWNEVKNNPFFCPDKQAAQRWEALLLETRKAGSSLGAVVEITASNMPVGLGAPIYAKLDSDLAAAMMSINAVKGVEIGAGFASASMRGEEIADEMEMGNDKAVRFLSNNAGGVLGGISSGADLVVRFAVKPTSSIPIAQRSVSAEGENVEIATGGRHDPCVGIRAVPVGEAMAACVLADHTLLHKTQAR